MRVRYSIKFFGRNIILKALIFLLFSSPAFAEKRIALVVGNSSYQNVPPLDNPANDARLIADTLRSLGFALVGAAPQLDLDKASFDKVVRSFGQELQGADVALFGLTPAGVTTRRATEISNECARDCGLRL
jgi:Caspase domain